MGLFKLKLEYRKTFVVTGKCSEMKNINIFTGYQLLGSVFENRILWGMPTGSAQVFDSTDFAKGVVERRLTFSPTRGSRPGLPSEIKNILINRTRYRPSPSFLILTHVLPGISKKVRIVAVMYRL